MIPLPRIGILSASLAAFLMLSSCREADIVAPGTTWHLKEVNGRDVAQGNGVTLMIPAQGELRGHAPCSTYGAAWSGIESDFRPERIHSASIACPRLAAEKAYLSALSRVTSAEVSSQELVLAGPGVTLLFTPNPSS